MFNSDVLPAPLGPMIEAMAPRFTEIETSSTARTPPNRFDTARTSSSMSSESKGDAAVPLRIAGAFLPKRYGGSCAAVMAGMMLAQPGECNHLRSGQKSTGWPLATRECATVEAAGTLALGAIAAKLPDRGSATCSKAAPAACALGMNAISYRRGNTATKRGEPAIHGDCVSRLHARRLDAAEPAAARPAGDPGGGGRSGRHVADERQRHCRSRRHAGEFELAADPIASDRTAAGRAARPAGGRWLL